jgi:hypothetical protein
MASLYARWMERWETRLTSVDNNRVVRPLEWGIEWTRTWPCANGAIPAEGDQEYEEYLAEYNQRAVQASDEFFSYQPRSDFAIETRPVEIFSTRDKPDPRRERRVRGTWAEFLSFTSAVRTPYQENNCVRARWFPAGGESAVVVLPHWNSDALAYVSLCQVLTGFGISVLRLTLPYHEMRRPAEIRRADYAVSANIGRTIDACRQAVVDLRSCLDWLEQQGYRRLGVLGTSLGSCYAFLAAAHDRRIQVAAFNHASTYFADVVWQGQSTRHIRAGLEHGIDLERLRRLWMAISPMSYFAHFARWKRDSLIVYAKYDLTFLPQYSRQVVQEFARYHLPHRVVVLPCGHYSTGEAPFKYLDGWYLVAFLAKALKG